MQTIKKKILHGSHALGHLKNLAASGKKIGLCHGHFNVVHPGHLRFLHHAKELCEVLVVALVAQDQLEGEQKERFFPTQDRAMGVAALLVVDQVVVLEAMSLEDLISILKPSVFVLGKEFDDEDRKPLVEAYQKLMDAHGGKMVFSSGEVSYASTESLYASPDAIHAERLLTFAQACQKSNINLLHLKDKVKAFANQNILVLGDTIIDQYIACDALGMSQEAPVLAIRELEAREFIGGAAIIACHVQSLGANCHFMSVIGKDEKGKTVRDFLSKYNVPSTLFEDPSRQTTFKIRYMVDNQKLLRVSRLQEHGISKDFERQILAKLREMAPKLDGIVIADFVYGVITDSLLHQIQEIAQQHKIRLFGDLQCSSQVGNVTKFTNFHLITPTEREARIALADPESGLEKLARKLLNVTQVENLLLTLGASGFIAYVNEGEQGHSSQHFPALCQNPLDVAGAGDTLLSTFVTSLCAGNNLMESAALGACASAIAVARLGNTPITTKELLAYLDNLNHQLKLHHGKGA